MKGKAQIILTDVRDGSEKIIHEENMFTNALDSLFNGNPGGIVSPTLYGSSTRLNTQYSGIYDPYTYQNLLTALGGVLIFPEQLEENANKFYAPASNYPTGYASNDGTDGTDTRRGSFIAAESEFIENGFKFTWDFGTSQANGTWASIALTHAWGGKSYLREKSGYMNGAVMGSVSSQAVSQAMNGRFNLDVGVRDGSGYQFIMITEEYVVYALSGVIYKTRWPLSRISLNPTVATNEFISASEKVCDTPLTGVLGYIQNSGEDFFVTKRTSTTKLDYALVNIITGDVTATGSWTISGTSFHASATGVFAKIGNYIYYPTTSNTWMRFNTQNLADVSLIDMPFVTANYTRNTHATPIGDAVHTVNGIILGTTGYQSTDYAPPRQKLHGVWLVGANYSTNSSTVFSLSATPYTPYLATINNLATPVVKDASKTAKIVYWVTEVV